MKAVDTKENVNHLLRTVLIKRKQNARGVKA